MPSLVDAYPAESIVRRAYEFAEEAHREQKRESGEPYFIHCERVAEKVCEWGLDEYAVAAALLHDIVEDTTHPLKEIEKKFGSEVAFLVNGLTKLARLQYPEGQVEAENLRKLVVFFANDLRVILIKLADRLHNMETLDALPEERRQRFAWETMEIYAPLAYRLGMQNLSGDLEDLAFPYVYPEEYRWLMDTMEESHTERLAYILRVKPELEKLLAAHSIKPISVDARAKHHYSLYRKLQHHDMDMEKIYDLAALRVVVGTVEECYTALGAIHQTWPPLPGRIKDYIARPKPNGYQSLHTVVFCLDHRITEIQIRTEEMHREAELGIAAHWAYQQLKKQAPEKIGHWKGVSSRRELLWVEQLREWQERLKNPAEFMHAIKTDFLKNRIFVITPQNEVIDLPAGATPIDFAYQIHSEIGDRCVGAKVNGKMVPLHAELQSGDMVEIITQRGKKPSEDWLTFAKTDIAKKRIRSATRGTVPKEESYSELKIVNEDGAGYLKGITAAFAELKINITFLQSQTDPRKKFSTITIHAPALSEERLARLLVKLKKIKGTLETHHRVIR